MSRSLDLLSGIGSMFGIGSAFTQQSGITDMAQQQLNAMQAQQGSMEYKTAIVYGRLNARIANVQQLPKTDYELALEELDKEFPGVRDIWSE